MLMAALEVEVAPQYVDAYQEARDETWRRHVSPWRPRRRAYTSPNGRRHWRIVSYVTLLPRSARRFSTFRKLRLNRWCNHTA